MRLKPKFITATMGILVCLNIPAYSQLKYAFSQAGSYPGPPHTTTVALAASTTQIVGDYFSPGVNPHAYIQTGRSFITAEPVGAGASYLSGINRNGLAAGGFCQIGCNIETGQHGYTYNYSSRAVATIDYPGAGTSTSYGINNHGDVVGGFCVNTTSCPLTSNSNTDHGYLDVSGVFTQLDFPGAESTQAMAINDAGVIVGAYNINHTGPHGFIYQNGVYTNIDYPGGGYTFPSAINNLGVAAGLMSDSTGIHGFLYRNGKFEKISDPSSPNDTEMTGNNDKNDVVGNGGTQQGYLTFKGIPKK